MAGRGISDFENSSNICSQCGKHVEILNSDVDFSMELHMQSHKPLNVISQEFETQMGKAEFRPTGKNNEISKYRCLDCNEYIKILNNNVTYSLYLHAQNHKYDSKTFSLQLDTQNNKYDSKSNTQDNLSTCSSNSAKSDKIKMKENPQLSQVHVIDEVFNAMAPNLKNHRDFIFENCNGKASCNVCNITIESVFILPEHLKTKMHEDNTIAFFNKSLPISLRQVMDFVSFYGSNLSCNLCSCKINWCSKNPYETIVNIIAHNNDKDHLNRLTNGENLDKSFTLLNSLAQISPLIEENKKCIAYKIEPNFQCKLCDKQIAYDDNENVLLNNFTTHLNGADHCKWFAAEYKFESVKKSLTKEETKHLVVFQNNQIEVNYDQIMSHRERCKNISATPDPNIAAPTPVRSSETSNSEIITEHLPPVTVERFEIADLKKLMARLPGNLKNMTCLTVNEHGHVICLVCDCPVSACTYNLETHLLGKRHKSNENIGAHSVPHVVSDISDGKNNIVNLYKSLVQTDPLIAMNSKVLQKYKDTNYYTCTLCTVLIEVSSDLHIFQFDCHSHLESFEHMYNLELKSYIGIIQDTSVCVKKLFELLPSHIRVNLIHLKVYSIEQKILLCSLCNIKMSAHVNCLQQHIEGGLHRNALPSLNMPTTKNGITFYQDVDSVLTNIMINDEVIKLAIKYFTVKDGHIFCNICKCFVRNSNSMKSFRDTLSSHIEGNRHMRSNKLVVLLDTLNKLQMSDPVIRCNKIYLKLHIESVYCMLCSCNISSSTEEKSLQEILSVHLSDDIHLSKIDNLM